VAWYAINQEARACLKAHCSDLHPGFGCVVALTHSLKSSQMKYFLLVDESRHLSPSYTSLLAP